MRFPRTLYLLPFTVFAILLTTQAYADSLNNKGANIGKDNGAALNALLPLAEEGQPRRSTSWVLLTPRAWAGHKIMRKRDTGG